MPCVARERGPGSSNTDSASPARRPPARHSVPSRLGSLDSMVLSAGSGRFSEELERSRRRTRAARSLDNQVVLGETNSPRLHQTVSSARPRVIAVRHCCCGYWPTDGKDPSPGSDATETASVWAPPHRTVPGAIGLVTWGSRAHSSSPDGYYPTGQWAIFPRSCRLTATGRNALLWLNRFPCIAPERRK